MPQFPIIDSHVHLYDPKAVNYPWMSDVPLLNKPHLPNFYDERTIGLKIDKLVFVEVDSGVGEHLKEARWVQNLNAVDPRISAIVAAMPLEQGYIVERDVAEFAELGLARGVRRLIQGHVDRAGWCLRPDFVAGVQLLAKYNLSFDICIKHQQLPDAIQLVRMCPDVFFVLDHIAKPNIGGGVFHPWAENIKLMAQLPNVVCKISGAITEASHTTWTADQVKPYVAHAIKCFGFARVMFGGDWPVLELAARYPQWVDVVDDVVKDASVSEQRMLYRETAERVYRL